MTGILSDRQYRSRIVEVYPAAIHDEESIMKAFDLACRAHEGQLRKLDQTPYIGHPITVSLRLAEKYQDTPCVIA